jgi:hypothetical protein
MPDGAMSSEDEGAKKSKKPVKPKDGVIDALDQNLDM